MARNLPPVTRSQRLTAWACVGLLGAMVGLAYASVPLYRIFCQVTGYGGTTQRAEGAPGEPMGVDRTITVRFNADVSPNLAWDFQPEQRSVQVKVGEETLISYRAHNRSKQAITGTAVFNVTPDKAGVYFDKIACFCFTEQRLEPGQTADLPVSFFVDPEIVKDHKLDDVKTITLSYTFYAKRTETAALAAAN